MGDPAEKQKIICPLTTREVCDKIIEFQEALTLVKLYTYQALFARRVIESVLLNDGATITALWARQCGKTETVADICTAMAILLPVLAREFPDDPRFQSFRQGFLVGVYAPIDKQALISFGRMRKIVNSIHGQEFLSDPDLNVQVLANRGDTLSFSNGSRIFARTASPESQIEGDTHHLVVAEEAQKLGRAKVEKEIRPMLAATNGTMVKIGTAWISRGGFHSSIQHNVELHHKHGIRNHFEFPYDIVISEKRRQYERDNNVFHLNYEKFVKAEIFRLGGTDSEEFKMNFRCLWQESRVIAIRPDVFEAAAIESLEAGPKHWGVQVAGLDIGKVTDSTVLTIVEVDTARPIVNPHTLPDAEEEKQVYYEKTVLDWVELGGNFEGNTGQYRRLVDYLMQTNVKVLAIDASSIGDPVFERIEAMLGHSIMCIPVKFAPMTKSYLYKYFLQELHSRRVKYAAGPETKKRIEFMKFVQEHTDLDKTEHTGYTLCQAPEGGHDDFPDSLALACWAEKQMASIAMPMIEVGDGLIGSTRRNGNVEGSQQRTPFGSVLGEAVAGRAGRYGKRW